MASADRYSHRQLYDFAHRALPQILFSDPATFFMVLSGPQATDFLNDIGQLVNDKLQEANEPFDPAPFQCKSTTARIGDFPAVIVELPPPNEATECHYVCAVWMLNLALEPRPDPKTIALRYFALEHSPDAPHRTMLCGWQMDQQGARHLNFGAGPAPGDIRKFAESVKNLLPPSEGA